MEFFGILISLVAIGYIIFIIALPFTINSGLRRINALEKKLAKLDDSLREQSKILSRLKEQETEPVKRETVAAVEDATPVVEIKRESLQPSPEFDEAAEEKHHGPKPRSSLAQNLHTPTQK